MISNAIVRLATLFLCSLVPFLTLFQNFVGKQASNEIFHLETVRPIDYSS